MPKTPNHNAVSDPFIETQTDSCVQEGDEEAGEREEAEDDAPEAVQAQNQQSSNQSWSTYPDLLRVQRSKSRTNPVVEDNPPEGQEPGSSRASNAVPRPAAAAALSLDRETGTIPKRAPRPAPPPDLTTRRSDVPRVPAAARDGDARVERLERQVDQLRTERSALQQQRGTDEAKEAELRHSNEVQVQLAAITASVQSLNHLIVNLNQTMGQRLDQLETRLNNLVTSGSAVAVDTTGPLRHELHSLIQNQRQVSFKLLNVTIAYYCY
jgi:hypothetical protein